MFDPRYGIRGRVRQTAGKWRVYLSRVSRSSTLHFLPHNRRDVVSKISRYKQVIEEIFWSSKSHNCLVNDKPYHN